MGSELISEQSALLQLFQSFTFGFLSSLTPCVFPLIPITLALFGARESSSHFKGFLLACAYVAGIATTYTALGMASAKLGVLFGAALGNPWVVLVLAFFLVVVALHTLEVYELKFLGSVQTGASKVGGKGYLGAYLMGTASGFVAAPCIGPALIIILGAAAASKSMAWGAALLFCYSLGLGIIFIILGTYSNLISKLPKSGNWLNAMKFFLGTMLFMVIIFLSERYLLSLPQRIVTLLIIENLSLYLAWYSYRHDKKIMRLIAAVLLSVSLYQFFIAKVEAKVEHASTAEIVWHSDIEQAISLTKSEKRVAMVDLYADWCAACKELDSRTFTDAGVKSKFKEIITARVDFTDTESPAAVSISDRYQIPGLPCILFLKPDGSGEEIPNSRITGFVPAAEFLDHLEKVLNSVQ